MALSRLSSSLLILLATGTLLTACDLNNDDSEPAATTSSVPDQNPVTPSTSSFLTGVRNVLTEAGVTTELVLVDDATGTEVAATTIDLNTRPKVAQAFTVSADGKSYVAGRQTVAYYVHEQKLYEISLEHVTNELSQPEPRQVNTETQVCQLRSVVETNATASTNLLSYTTAGEDGDCSTSEDNLDKTALSIGGDAAVQTVRLVDVQRDSAGAITQVLGLQTVNGKSALVAASASTLQVSNVINGDLAAGLPSPTEEGDSKLVSVSVFSKIVSAPAKVYLLVGNEVRLLDWSGTTPTLGTAAIATLGLAQTPIVHADDGKGGSGEATYFVNAQRTAPSSSTYELALWRIKLGQVAAEKVSSLSTGSPEDLPELAGHAMTPSSIALVVRHGDTDTLTVIKKDGGSQRNIALSGPTLHIDTLAHAGDVLLVSQQLVTGEDAVSLSRIELANNDAISQLSASGSLVTVINSPSRSLAGEADDTHLLWREGSNVLSYNLSSNTPPLTIADSGTLNDWDGGMLRASVSNQTQGLLLGVSATTPSNQKLWPFNANKAAAITPR